MTKEERINEEILNHKMTDWDKIVKSIVESIIYAYSDSYKPHLLSNDDKECYDVVHSFRGLSLVKKNPADGSKQLLFTEYNLSDFIEKLFPLSDGSAFEDLLLSNALWEELCKIATPPCGKDSSPCLKNNKGRCPETEAVKDIVIIDDGIYYVYGSDSNRYRTRLAVKRQQSLAFLSQEQICLEKHTCMVCNQKWYGGFVNAPLGAKYEVKCPKCGALIMKKRI